MNLEEIGWCFILFMLGVLESRWNLQHLIFVCFSVHSWGAVGILILRLGVYHRVMGKLIRRTGEGSDLEMLGSTGLAIVVICCACVLRTGASVSNSY